MSGGQGRGKGRQPCGTEPAGVARPGNRLCQLSPGVPGLGAGPGQSRGATASLPLPEGEPNISLVLFQGWHPLGGQPLLLGALLLLVPTDDTSTTQGASVLCQEQLSPTSSAHHTRSLCTGSGRRVSGGLRRWSLGRGCSRAALRTKPGGSRLRAPTMSPSGVPPHPQSQLSRLRGACRSPGPRAGPGSCSTAAHKLLQPLRAALAPAWLRNAGARRARRRGGSRQHRQGLRNSVPLSWGGSSTGCSQGLGSGRAMPASAPTCRNRALYAPRCRSSTEAPSARFWSGMRALPGVGKAGWGRAMLPALAGACGLSWEPPQSPVRVSAKATLWVQMEAKPPGKHAVLHSPAGSQGDWGVWEQWR